MLRLTLRTLLARKVRLFLSGLAIVLGVAFLAGVLVFSNGIRTTFDGIINGSTPDGLVRVAGADSFSAGEGGVSTATLDPAVVTDLADLPEVDRADGNVEGFGMSLLAADGTLVGGTGAPTLAFNYTEAPNMAGDPTLELLEGAWPGTPDEIALDEGAAEAGGYAVGDEVKLLSPQGALDRTATLVGIAEFNGGGTAGATLLIFDTAGAQQLFTGGADVFTSIALTAAPGVSQAELTAAAQGVVPDGFTAVEGDTVVAESEDAIGEFLGVIETFLLVFAIIAVLVAGFIIVNTFTILVAQRSRELALLRALGASRRQVSRSVLLEAAAQALLASTLGILLGWGLAHGLAAIFGAVGLDIQGSALTLSPRIFAIGYAVGIVVTLLAAWLPARRAGRVAPVAAMQADVAPAARSLRRRAVIGTVLLLVGAGFAAAGIADLGNGAVLIGVGAVVWILTLAATSSVFGQPLLRVGRSVFATLFGTTGRLAGENALRDPRRTGATASALMIGLALVSTIGVLAASLNQSVSDVVDEEFASDFLVQSSTFTPFSTTIGDQMTEVDGVAEVSRQQWAGARVDGDRISISGVDDSFRDVYALPLVEGRQQVSGAEAFVTADFADERSLAVGDTVALQLAGARSLDVEVVGVVEGREVTAALNLPLTTLADAGIARQDSVLSILLESGADVEEVGAELDDIAAAAPVVGVFDKQEFADEIRGQINQLLYLIYALLALAVVIAIIGIVNTLGLSVIERTREIGLLRAIGLNRRGLRRMVMLESVAIAVLGAVLGMALGVGVGSLLRYELREDLTSLGLPLGQLAVFLGLAVVVGVLAAVVPAIRAARLNVLDAITTE
ncbi:ABC transporter permease [Nocardioides panacisoli]|uniref:ABC transporter permease n=1 Tax=Nocardioides panacisoli TaxID=627624 RepID=UPI001C630572|nr:ABC transporter permease [Nocardioides panacisoli]QYJ04996.1 ABC transporter permease [Nocardioides panacisoli]